MSTRAQESKYEDWLKTDEPGRVALHTVNPEKAHLEDVYHIGGAAYPASEYQKILDRQRKAYDYLISEVAAAEIGFFKHELDGAEQPDKLLQYRIERLGDRIRPHQEQLAKGYKDPSVISGRLSEVILEGEWASRDDILQWDYHGAMPEGSLIWAWCDYLQLQHLERMAANPPVDTEKLDAIAKRANQLLSQDFDTYGPYRGDPLLSNNLKNQLADEFQMGESTVHDYFNKHLEKIDKTTYRIKY